MGWLITLIIAFVVFSSISKKNKKQQKKNKETVHRSYKEDTLMRRAEEMGITPEQLKKDMARAEARRRELQKIKAAAEAALEAAAEAVPETGCEEGMFSTEGESEDEHRGHVERIKAEETVIAARENANHARVYARREHLRAAVVTREILDRPLSLRDE